MRIIVIGGTGVIGSAVVKELSQRHEVISVSSKKGELTCDDSAIGRRLGFNLLLQLPPSGAHKCNSEAIYALRFQPWTWLLMLGCYAPGSHSRHIHD